MKEQDIPTVVDDSAERIETSAGEVIEQKRLESLLLDDSSRSPSVDYLLSGSRGVIGGRKVKHSGSLIILLLLVTFLFGAGYYFLSSIATKTSPVTQTDLYVSPMIPVPSRPQIDNPSVVMSEDTDETPSVKKEINSSDNTAVIDSAVPLYTVAVGPFINDVDLQQATSLLEELGLQPQKIPGRGPVMMTRLLEGVYPEAEARTRLAELKKMVKSAFLLPFGDKLAVYTGSFHQEDRAREMQNDLALKGVDVSLVDSEVTLNGTLLVALQADQQTANEVAAHISSLGLHTQLLKKK